MKLITVATGAVALGAALQGAAAAADAVHPFTPVEVTGAVAFLETFTGGDLGAWTPASDEKYAGVASVVKADGTEDDGLYVPEAAKHYGVSAPLATPFDPKDGLTLQYEATLQDGLECGGAYLKFLTAHGDHDGAALNGDTPYTVMFGPDKCGGTNKVHVIFRHSSPDGTIEEKHLKSPPSVPFDRLPHLYTLVVRPDNTFEVKVDGETQSQGSLFDSFDPPFNPPEEIDDPDDSKPDDWVDAPKIDDPDAVKPEDWDEDAPMQIDDEDAVKPEGWLDDEPAEIEDPDAVKPDDWDDDEDGDWEAPIVPNPLCTKGPGCGEWVRPKKHNPDYKGKWYPPMIDNPEYKGPWAPRKIPNPKHFKDENPLANVGSVGAVAMEIWTMSKGLVVDNVLVAADDVAAKELQETQWRPKYEALKTVKDVKDAEEAKKAEEAISPGRGFKGMVVDAVSGVAAVAPGALGDKLNDFATVLENPDNVAAFYAFCVGVALIVALLFTAVADLFAGSSGEDAKKSAAKKKEGKKAAKAKKTDETEPDDEPADDAAEEDGADGEEEEDEAPKTATKRRTKRG